MNKKLIDMIFIKNISERMYLYVMNLKIISLILFFISYDFLPSKREADSIFFMVKKYCRILILFIIGVYREQIKFPFRIIINHPLVHNNMAVQSLYDERMIAFLKL